MHKFRKGILDFRLECITLLQNDFFKQRYITFNVTIPGQDRIDPNTHLCRTFLLGILILFIPALVKHTRVGSISVNGVRQSGRYFKVVKCHKIFERFECMREFIAGKLTCRFNEYLILIEDIIDRTWSKYGNHQNARANKS